MLICLYVDDLIYMANNQEMLTDFKQSMTKEFEMSDMEIMKYFLGIQVKQAKGEIFIP